eukprot:TRINITY_DN2142_c0_g2_i1.p1 TRINITY_DN2142_c0_g2~~TRINITY_DN2142_c0_g2_i1.p1  ORF type:complete len:1804 (+),score=451.15 TRINITY_DN2142_c0_g2_i1:83-5494(+)
MDAPAADGPQCGCPGSLAAPLIAVAVFAGLLCCVLAVVLYRVVQAESVRRELEHELLVVRAQLAHIQAGDAFEYESEGEDDADETGHSGPTADSSGSLPRRGSALGNSLKAGLAAANGMITSVIARAASVLGGSPSSGARSGMSSSFRRQGTIESPQGRRASLAITRMSPANSPRRASLSPATDRLCPRENSRSKSLGLDGSMRDSPTAEAATGCCVALCFRWDWAEPLPPPAGGSGVSTPPDASQSQARAAAARECIALAVELAEAHGASLEASTGSELRLSFGLRPRRLSIVPITPPQQQTHPAFTNAVNCGAALLRRGMPSGARLAGVGIAHGTAEAGRGLRGTGYFVGPAPETAALLAAACPASAAPALVAAPSEAVAAAQVAAACGRLRQFAATTAGALSGVPLWALEPSPADRAEEAAAADAALAAVWRALSEERGAEAMVLLQQLCCSCPADAIAQNILYRLRFATSPQVAVRTVVTSSEAAGGGLLPKSAPPPRVARSVACFVMQPRAAAPHVDAADHGALMRVFAHCVVLHGGELVNITGYRLAARWLSPAEPSDHPHQYVTAACACAAEALRRAALELRFPTAAGLAQGHGICGDLGGIGVLPHATMLSDALQRAEALAGCAAADGFELLAEGVFAADAHTAWRAIAPTAEVRIAGAPNEPVRLCGGVCELAVAPPAREYSRAIEEIRKWQWAKSAGLLQRLCEQQGERDDSDWVVRLLNSVLRAEREERDGLRGAEEDLVAEASFQGIRFRPAALASPGTDAVQRGKLGRLRSMSRRSFAEDVSQAASPCRRDSLSSALAAKRTAQKWRLSLTSAQAAFPDRQATDISEPAGKDDGAALDGDRLVDLARLELAEAAAPSSPANDVMKSPVSETASQPRSPTAQQRPRLALQRLQTNTSFGMLPPSPTSRRAHKPGLRMMRNRDLVRSCLHLRQRVPRRLLEALAEAGDETKSAGHCWHLVAKWWNPLRMVALMYNCIMIPARSVYGGNPASTSGQVVMLLADYLLDLVYWGDIVLNFREPIYIDGNRVTDKHIIAQEYLRSWFAFDVLMCAPWELGLALYLGSVQVLLEKPFLRFNRCLNILRFKDLVNTVHQDFFEDVHPVKMQLFVFLVCLFYMLHWLGCLWGLVYVGTFSVAEDARIYDTGGKGDVYAVSMGVYWAINGFAGYSMKWPQRTPHYVVSLICSVCGLGIFATVIAYMSTLLRLIGTSQQAHYDQVERLVSFSEYTDMDDEFLTDLIQYHRMLWAKTRQAYPDQWADLTAEEGMAVDSSLQLPGDIAKEMCYYTNYRVVESIPALRSGCDPSFTVKVVTHMSQHYGAPGEPLFTRGTTDDSTIGGNAGLWFLVQGSAEASIAGESVEFLGAGDFWGEIVALGKAETQSADVRLLEYSEVYHMPREDFSELVGHPDYELAAAEFRETAERRQEAILQAARRKRADSVSSASPSELSDPRSDHRASGNAAPEAFAKIPPLLPANKQYGSFGSRPSTVGRFSRTSRSSIPGSIPPALSPPPHPGRLGNMADLGSHLSLPGLAAHFPALQPSGSIRSASVTDSPQLDDLPRHSSGSPLHHVPALRLGSLGAASDHSGGSFRHLSARGLGEGHPGLRKSASAQELDGGEPPLLPRQSTDYHSRPRQRRVSIASTAASAAVPWSPVSRSSLNVPKAGTMRLHSAGSAKALTPNIGWAVPVLRSPAVVGLPPDGSPSAPPRSSLTLSEDTQPRVMPLLRSPRSAGRHQQFGERFVRASLDGDDGHGTGAARHGQRVSISSGHSEQPLPRIAQPSEGGVVPTSPGNDPAH